MVVFPFKNSFVAPRAQELEAHAAGGGGGDGDGGGDGQGRCESMIAVLQPPEKVQHRRYIHAVPPLPQFNVRHPSRFAQKISDGTKMVSRPCGMSGVYGFIVGGSEA